MQDSQVDGNDLPARPKNAKELLLQGPKSRFSILGLELKTLLRNDKV